MLVVAGWESCPGSETQSGLMGVNGNKFVVAALETPGSARRLSTVCAYHWRAVSGVNSGAEASVVM